MARRTISPETKARLEEKVRARRQANIDAGLNPDGTAPKTTKDSGERGLHSRIPEASGPNAITIAEEKFVMEKSVLGYTPRQIADLSDEVLGYPIKAKRVTTLLSRAMNRTLSGPVAEKRLLENLRLDSYLTRLDPYINPIDPDTGEVGMANLDAVKLAVFISKERRKLYGLDIPNNLASQSQVTHSLDPALMAMLKEAQEREAREENPPAPRKRAPRKQAAPEIDNVVEAEVVEDTMSSPANTAGDQDADTDDYQEEMEGIFEPDELDSEPAEEPPLMPAVLRLVQSNDDPEDHA